MTKAPLTSQCQIMSTKPLHAFSIQLQNDHSIHLILTLRQYMVKNNSFPNQLQPATSLPRKPNTVKNSREFLITMPEPSTTPCKPASAPLRLPSPRAHGQTFYSASTSFLTTQQPIPIPKSDTRPVKCIYGSIPTHPISMNPKHTLAMAAIPTYKINPSSQLNRKTLPRP
jgi:hypothetical protein